MPSQIRSRDWPTRAEHGNAVRLHDGIGMTEGSGGSRDRPPGARSRRRDDGSGQADVISAGLRYFAILDWPTFSSSDPIRWRPSANPGQKRYTGDRIVARRD
jgi:hypothetical protein